jgi:hypothetical protein
VTKLSTKVICDAGPFIHLDELKCIDLLADFEEVILPLVVEKEISQHRPDAFGHPAVRDTINRNAKPLSFNL